jgi:hypothetical protein
MTTAVTSPVAANLASLLAAAQIVPQCAGLKQRKTLSQLSLDCYIAVKQLKSDLN